MAFDYTPSRTHLYQIRQVQLIPPTGAALGTGLAVNEVLTFTPEMFRGAELVITPLVFIDRDGVENRYAWRHELTATMRQVRRFNNFEFNTLLGITARCTVRIFFRNRADENDFYDIPDTTMPISYRHSDGRARFTLAVKRVAAIGATGTLVWTNSGEASFAYHSTGVFASVPSNQKFKLKVISATAGIEPYQFPFRSVSGKNVRRIYGEWQKVSMQLGALYDNTSAWLNVKETLRQWLRAPHTWLKMEDLQGVAGDEFHRKVVVANAEIVFEELDRTVSGKSLSLDVIDELPTYY